MSKNSVKLKRLFKEIKDNEKEKLTGIELKPLNDDKPLNWFGILNGPIGSPYEGGTFEVLIDIPNDYPFSPPKLTFKTQIYHCNISRSGNVCLDILKTAWSPALSLQKVMLSLSSLLTDCNPNDPLDTPIAKHYIQNKEDHDNTARQWTDLYAKPKLKHKNDKDDKDDKDNKDKPNKKPKVDKSVIEID